MSDAVFQRTPAVSRIQTAKRAGRLPSGYGLVIAAVASIGLWVGIFWIAGLMLG